MSRPPDHPCDRESSDRESPSPPRGTEPEDPRPEPEPPNQALRAHPKHRARLVRLGLAFYAGLFAVAVLWAAVSGHSLLYASARAELRGIDPVRDVGSGALAGAIVILVSWQLAERTGWGRNLARSLAGLIGPLSLPACLVLAAASGLAEEAFFRGALQPRVGLVAASLLFGLVHFAPIRELLPWTFLSVAVGFLLGALFESTGNLVAPVAAHVLINAVNLPLLVTHYAPRD